MRQILHYIFNLIRRGHWWAEFWSALVAIGWGSASFVMNAEVRPIASNGVITSIMPGAAIELFALFVGAAQFITLVLDLRWPRAASAFFAGWFYGFIALGACASVGFYPNIIPFAGFVGINMFAVGRLCGNLR
jgi:hypothetical protein